MMEAINREEQAEISIIDYCRDNERFWLKVMFVSFFVFVVLIVLFGSYLR